MYEVHQRTLFIDGGKSVMGSKLWAQQFSNNATSLNVRKILSQSTSPLDRLSSNLQLISVIALAVGSLFRAALYRPSFTVKPRYLDHLRSQIGCNHHMRN